MKKEGIILLVISILLISISFVSAEFNETEIVDTMPKAGITPDSVFYGFDVFFDNARATLALRKLSKSKIRLDIMGERVAEMEEMVSKNKTAEAERAKLEVQKQMQKFERSVEKIKKKDAPELNAYVQNYNARLEERKRRMTNYGQAVDYTDAIADAIRILEEVENVIVNIPEDLDPEATFKLSLICEEAGATTAEECEELISSGALIATVRRIPYDPNNPRPPDPHGCSGFYASRGIKRCCEDSDGTYSQEWIEMREEEGMSNILDYYHRKGTVEYKIITLDTEEIEEGIETDSCDGDTLTEWFCPRVMDPITLNKRFSDEYECPNGCENGACIICNSDSICDRNEDCSCSDCEGKRNGCDYPRSVCQNGECVYKMEGVGQECTDSDGGIDYFVKGIVNASYISGPTTYYYTTTDRCINEILREGLCGTDEARVVMYSCPNGCEDGACIS